MSDRKQRMQDWLKDLGYDLSTLQVASEDASFRRYFRIKKGSDSYIVMDAPPENESCDSFVALANSLTQHGNNAPRIHDENLIEGFLVLSDFGDDLLLGLLNDETVNPLYEDAMAAIIQLQKSMPVDSIPEYSATMLDVEMELFQEWFVDKLLNLEMSKEQYSQWQNSKDVLIKNAIQQPQTFVHRDFHSRNLIKTPSGDIGLIDFQDAVKGAMTYDVVSLLRDCYIAWPQDKIEQWLRKFYKQSEDELLLKASFDEFKTWFNLMGVQRHLKAIGIFSRLKLRDGKNGYIADIPRTLNYIEQVSRVEPSLKGLQLIIQELNLLDLINKYGAA